MVSKDNESCKGQRIRSNALPVVQTEAIFSVAVAAAAGLSK